MRKKEENKGITLVSLVVTVIVLIILAGVSINLVLGENGILTMAKKAKENMELAQVEEQEKLNELYTDFEGEFGETGGEISYDAIAKLNDFKKKIADYIEEAGGIKPEYTDSTETFGQKIKEIVKEVTKSATATADNITEGKTAWVNGKLLTGILKENSGASILLNISNANTGYSYTLTKDSKILLIATATRAAGFKSNTTIYYPTITITLNDETITCESSTSYHLLYRGEYMSAPSYDTAGTKTSFQIIDAKKDDVIKIATSQGNLSIIMYEI